MKYDMSHGSPWDRGAADSYYRRQFNPHYWLDSMGREVVELAQMTAEEIVAYTAGFNHNEEEQNFKDWGQTVVDNDYFD